MSDTDNSSNDTQEYGNQPPVIPGEEASFDAERNADAAPDDTPEASPAISNDSMPIINDIIGKIDEASNILVALSSDPSVDELATAIGLSLSLDKLGKRVTTIYSGETPDALSFLKPENTFESKPDTLQDFVIALNKEKADHLRYKVDGDYVKIFITPYRSRIDQEDLEFSYGDFNVDLVIALDVANGVDLDSALREHGRIMHDATIIDITTSKPGKLGEIEWSDTKASSVSEMVAELLLIIGKMEKPEATALLTGIIAATDRFANSRTTSHSLEVASQLIGAGADQQVVAKNIASDLDGDGLSRVKVGNHSDNNESIADSIRKNATTKSSENDPMSLDISHDDESNDEGEPENDIAEEPPVLDEKEETPPEEEEQATDVEEPTNSIGSKTTIMPPSEQDNTEETEEEAEEEALTEDLEATEATLSNAGAEVIPEAEKKPFSLEVNSKPKEKPKEEPEEEAAEESEDGSNTESEDESKPEDESESEDEAKSEDESSSDLTSQNDEEGEKGNDEDNDGIVGPFGSDDEEEEEATAEVLPSNDFISDKAEKIIAPTSSPDNSSIDQPNNPAALSAPEVASAPEANNIPDMNYMPMPGDEILPPPPTPPVDFNSVTPPADSAAPSIMPPASPMSTPSPSSNPFLNTPPTQPSFMPGVTPNQATPFSPAMPPMSAPNTNPFAAQPSMPGQMNNNPPMNNPGSFQIPGM